MKRAIFHELADVVATHRNNDLLPGGAFGGHLDTRFRLRRAGDDFMNMAHPNHEKYLQI